MPQRLEVRFGTPEMGVRNDITPTEMPPNALFDGQNMVMRNGRFQPRYGLSSFSTAAGTKVVGMASFGPTLGWGTAAGTADRVVVGTTNGWYRLNAGAWTAITGSGLTSSSHIIFRIFNKNNANYLVGINNGSDAPIAWDGVPADAAAAVGGNPPKAKAMMILANRLMLFNLTTNTGYTGVVSPVGYDVSAFNDFNSGWSTTLNGLLVDTPGDIIGALEMGDLQGAIYKTDAVVMAVAQGGVNPFHFEWRSIGNVGPANGRCILSVRDGSHIFLGADGGVHRFDGVSVRALDEGTGHIKAAMLRMADPDLSLMASKAWGFYDRARNEAVFFVKSNSNYGSGNVDVAVLIRLDNLSVWPLNYNFDTADVTAGGVINISGDTHPRVALFTGTTGKSWNEADNTMQDNGTNITSTWQYGYSDFGAPGVFKTVTESDHIFQSNTRDPNYATATGNQDILASLGLMDDSGNESTVASQTMSLTTSAGAQHILDHRTTALMAGPRYIVSVAKIFDYRGCVLRAVIRGER